MRFGNDMQNRVSTSSRTILFVVLLGAAIRFTNAVYQEADYTDALGSLAISLTLLILIYGALQMKSGN